MKNLGSENLVIQYNFKKKLEHGFLSYMKEPRIMPIKIDTSQDIIFVVLLVLQIHFSLEIKKVANFLM